MTDGIPVREAIPKVQTIKKHHATRLCMVVFSFAGTGERRKELEKKEKMSREQKDKQVRREARATLILFAICFIWNVGFAYGLSGSGIRIGGMPLWWLLSTPGMFVVAVVGVVYLLKKVFVNFDLEDSGKGGAQDE